ncbi:hypothetical protein E2986_12928 [Frieseomelitta varia]|uniref:2-oxoglutarate dehydrogenase E1 component N-terminal domain-containing protein n=1 Tax=Frieseomelitta varia TaxID=561572 RepID=A0A833RIR7_9HYME|nr:hypothetical protein E2986_12928 [Frieseomelitta varia]
MLKGRLFVSVKLQQRQTRFSHDDRGSSRRSNKYDYLLNMTNSQYLDHMYQSWKKNPDSVNPSWNSYFRSIYADNLPESATSSPPADSNSSRTFTSKDSTPSTVSASTRIESSSNIIPSNFVGAQSSGRSFS